MDPTDAVSDGRVLEDRYELISLVGTGGMAEVWCAHDRRLGRDVAVKLLTGHAVDDSARRRRIEREARALAATNHPNIVSVYDYGEAEGPHGSVQPFVVMELVDGPDLQQHLVQTGPLEVREAVGMMSGILAAVDRAHEAGVVHGDLKPANIFVSSHGPKVGDFGVARILEEETGSTTVAATPTFAAPEVLKGERPSTSSDVYSAACLAFELLAGRPPYAGANGWEIAQKHIDAPVPSVRSFRSDVPVELDRAIKRGMDKDPRRRHATAGDLATAIAATTPSITTSSGDETVAVGTVSAAGVTASEGTEVISGLRPNIARAAVFGPMAGWWARVSSASRARMPKGKRGRALLAVLVALLLLVAFITLRNPAPGLVTVPDVVGKKVADASASLRLKGFKVDDVSYRAITKGEPDRVLTTIPSPDEIVEPGTNVHLIASAPARTPDPVVTSQPDEDDDGDGDGERRGGRRGRNKKND